MDLVFDGRPKRVKANSVTKEAKTKKVSTFVIADKKADDHVP